MESKFNPSGGTRAAFELAIRRALNDMTDDEIRSAIGTEMSQRQAADLEIDTIFSAAIARIGADLTLKADQEDYVALEARVAALEEIIINGGGSNA